MDLYCASFVNEPLHPSCSESASTPKFARNGSWKETVLDPALFTDWTGLDGIKPCACSARQFLSKWPFFLKPVSTAFSG